MAVLPGNSLPFNLLPSTQVPVVDRAFLVTVPWMQFFLAIVGQPQAIKAVSNDASPGSYTASQKGILAVAGGTVSSITITRARVTIPAGLTNGLVALAQGDIATITYSAAPTLNFIPG